MDVLGELAAQGVLGLLSVILMGVVVYQNKLINTLQDKRLSDWQTALNMTTSMIEKSQQHNESLIVLVEGIDRTIQQITNRLDRRQR